MSLRIRLLGGMVVLVLVGLTVAAIATYAEQRSFLYDRLDQQVQSARGPITDELIVHRGGRGLLAGPFGPALLQALRRRFGAGRARPFDLPAGTVGELLDAAHRPVKAIGVSLGGVAVSAPRLPAHFAVSRFGAPARLFAFTGNGVRYRAAAVAVPEGTVVVAVPLREVDQTLHRLVLVELLVGIGVVLGLLVLGWFVIGVGLRPLERMRSVAMEISHGDLTRRVAPADSRTEVGRLGLALNTMLGQIEEAFGDRTDSENRLRRFLADASHELRTPLAAVRGYAELHRMGAASTPEDAARSMARIEAEAARMGKLVEGLLMLARLDELPEAELVPVEVTALADQAAADARAMAPERAVNLTAVGEQWALADADGLRQVLANLLHNAVIHTPPGSPIEVSVTGEGATVQVAVRDHGPGLPDGAGEAVFDRFWRSEGGRSRGRGGAGLGLAIVRAIVTAQHGEVRAADAPGGGARFTVSLGGATPHSANPQPALTERIQPSATVR